jgi:hypothetical protein
MFGLVWFLTWCVLYCMIICVRYDRGDAFLHNNQSRFLRSTQDRVEGPRCLWPQQKVIVRAKGFLRSHRWRHSSIENGYGMQPACPFVGGGGALKSNSFGRTQYQKLDLILVKLGNFSHYPLSCLSCIPFL